MPLNTLDARLAIAVEAFASATGRVDALMSTTLYFAFTTAPYFEITTIYRFEIYFSSAARCLCHCQPRFQEPSLDDAACKRPALPARR